MSMPPDPHTTVLHDAPEGAAVLRIVAGLHSCASRPLSRREMVLVGSGDDCDVVLADAGVAAHHALVNVVDGRFHLRALDVGQGPGRIEGVGGGVAVDGVQRRYVVFHRWAQEQPGSGISHGTKA